jgi:hypothetical protein
MLLRITFLKFKDQFVLIKVFGGLQTIFVQIYCIRGLQQEVRRVAW